MGVPCPDRGRRPSRARRRARRSSPSWSPTTPGRGSRRPSQALAAQDYPNLSVLVHRRRQRRRPDAAGRRRAARAPTCGGSTTTPASAPPPTRCCELVEGAAFYLLLPRRRGPRRPTPSGTLVEEAFRSNAGIVGPKLVDWDDPRRLLQVGECGRQGRRSARRSSSRASSTRSSTTPSATCSSCPGACMLVRADLFAALGGFDAGIDLPRRGPRPVLAGPRRRRPGAGRPAAPGRATSRRSASAPSTTAAAPAARRHRLRTVLTCYGRFHLLRVVPAGRGARRRSRSSTRCVVGRRPPGRATSSARGPGTCAASARSGPARRQLTTAIRGVPDNEVRRSRSGGAPASAPSCGARSRRRADRARAQEPVARARRRRCAPATPRWPARRLGASPASSWSFGSRDLLLDPIPAVGELPAVRRRPRRPARRVPDGWRTTGLGSSEPAAHRLRAPRPRSARCSSARWGIAAPGAHPRRCSRSGLLGVWRLPRPIGSLRARRPASSSTPPSRGLQRARVAAGVAWSSTPPRRGSSSSSARAAGSRPTATSATTPGPRAPPRGPCPASSSSASSSPRGCRRAAVRRRARAARRRWRSARSWPVGPAVPDGCSPAWPASLAAGVLHLPWTWDLVGPDALGLFVGQSVPPRRPPPRRCCASRPAPSARVLATPC